MPSPNTINYVGDTPCYACGHVPKIPGPEPSVVNEPARRGHMGSQGCRFAATVPSTIQAHHLVHRNRLEEAHMTCSVTILLAITKL